MARMLGKKKVLLGVFCSIIALLIGFRGFFLAKGAELCFSWAIRNEGWTVESLKTEGNKTLFQGIRGKNVSIPSGEISWNFSFFPFRLEPSVFLSEPSIVLQKDPLEKAESSWSKNLSLLAFSSLVELKVQVENGALSFPEQDSAFTFQVEPGKSVGELGLLHVYEKGEEFFKAGFSRKPGGFFSRVEMIKAKVSSIAPCFGFDWSHLDGDLTLIASCFFSQKKGLESVEAGFAGQDINVQADSSAFSLESKSLKGTFSFFAKEGIPLWKQVDLFMTFEDSALVTSQEGCTFGFKDSLGEIRLNPEEDPYVKILGSLISKGTCVPFSIEGKGELLESKAYWLQASLDFFLPDRESRIAISLCQDEKLESILQAECHQVVKEVADVMQVVTPFLRKLPYQMDGGEIDGKILARFLGSEMQSLEFSECKAKDFAFSLPLSGFSAQSEGLFFEGLLEKKEEIELVSSQAKIQKAKVLFGDHEFEEISAYLSVSEGEFDPSYIEGSYQGIKTSLQLLQRSASSILHVECGAHPKDLIKWIGSSKSVDKDGDPILLAFDIGEDKGNAHFSGIARIGQEDLEFEGNLPKKMSRSVKDLVSGWEVGSAWGGFHMESLSMENLHPYLPKELAPLEGNCKIEGFFTPQGLEIFIKNADLSFLDPKFCASGRLGEKNPIRIAYSKEQADWEAIIPLSYALLEEKSHSIPVGISESLFFWKKGRLFSDNWEATIAGTGAKGSFVLEESSLLIKVKEFRGEVASLGPYISKELDGWEGFFEASSDGCEIQGVKENQGWSWGWKLSARLEGISRDFGEFGLLHDVSALINANSNGVYGISGAEGDYSLHSLASHLVLEDFLWTKEKSAEFQLTAREGVKELIQLSGKIEQSQQGFAAYFNSNTHLLGIQPNLEPIFLDSKGELSKIAGEFSVKLQYLPAYISLGTQIGLFKVQDIPSLVGDLKIQASYEPRKELGDVKVFSKGISYLGLPPQELKAHMKKNGKILEIDSFSWGSYEGRMKLELGDPYWKILSCSLDSADMQLRAEGRYLPVAHELSLPNCSLFFRSEGFELRSKVAFDAFLWKGTSFIEGRGRGKLAAAVAAPFPVVIQSGKEFVFGFNSQKGIEIEKGDWELLGKDQKTSLGLGSTQKLRYIFSEGRFLCEGGALDLTKEGLRLIDERCLSFSSGKGALVQFDADISKAKRKVSGFLKNGSYAFSGASFDLKNIQFLLEQDNLYASCQSAWEKEAFVMQVHTKLGKKPVMTVLLKEELEKKGLSLQFMQSTGSKWAFESAKGSFRGVTLDVGRKDSLYETVIQVDFSKASSMFPKDLREVIQKWKIGDGYSYRGTAAVDFDAYKVTSLSGEVIGSQFQCLGRSFQSFKAKVAFQNNKALFQGISLEDDVGSVFIKSMEINKKPDIGWDFSSPLIHVKDFSPASLVPGKKETTIIKNISIYDVKGEIGTEENWLKTVRGTGSLHFIPTNQKAFSFWTVPLSLIKDLGLDAGMLTPVIGEADFTLLQGKMYFTALRNVYSEERRSQFDLAGTGTDSYLSLDGTWHVDLQMKQNVVLKVAEGFVLSIRGTLEKPKYSFKIKEKSYE